LVPNEISDLLFVYYTLKFQTLPLLGQFCKGRILISTISKQSENFRIWDQKILGVFFGFFFFFFFFWVAYATQKKAKFQIGWIYGASAFIEDVYASNKLGFYSPKQSVLLLQSYSPKKKFELYQKKSWTLLQYI